MLKIFVINLESSAERREKVTKRLDELGLSYELFSAVDGRQNPHPLFSRYNDKLRVRYRRKPLSGGELGCFASHFLLWEKCAAMDESIVVLEDDVVIHDDFLEALEIAEKIIEQVGYLRLAGTSLKKSPYSVIGSIQKFDFVEHHRGPTGTLCYVLNPQSAQTMLNHSETWCMAVDDHLDRYWLHGLYCYSLMPFPIRVGEGKSSITRKSKDKRISSIILRELFRRIEIIKRRQFSISNRSQRQKLLTHNLSKSINFTPSGAASSAEQG